MCCLSCVVSKIRKKLIRVLISSVTLRGHIFDLVSGKTVDTWSKVCLRFPLHIFTLLIIITILVSMCFGCTHRVLSSNFFFFVCQLSSVSLTHQLPTDPENVAALKPSSVVGREFFSCNQTVSINPPVAPAFMLSNCRICSVHEAGDVSALDPLPSSDLLDHFHPFSFYFVISLSFISVCDFAPLLCY